MKTVEQHQRRKRGSLTAEVADVENDLYRESPDYVFGLLHDELECGHIVQREI